MSAPSSAPAKSAPAVVAKKPPTLWAQVEPFVLGGASGMFATVCIQPMDMIKVRIQLAGEGSKVKAPSPVAVAKEIIAKDGFMYLYTGLGAGLLRQATYTTARLGIFRKFLEFMEDEKGQTTLAQKSLAGLMAGALGSIFGTPADVALIRMQADGTLPPEQRRGYTGVFNALTRIIREEGVGGMFKGVSPVVVRAAALNVGMLAGHDQVLETSKQYTDNKAVQQIVTKAASGFLASAFSLPFDFVKTRIQKQKPDPVTGQLPYKGSIDCALKCLKTEGPLAFYKGFVTYYARIAPHVMITLAAVDVLKAMVPKSWY